MSYRDPYDNPSLLAGGGATDGVGGAGWAVPVAVALRGGTMNKTHRMSRASVVTMGRLIISCVALTALCGCAGLSQLDQGYARRYRFIIHDTVHDDYMGEGSYTTKGNAKTYSYGEAWRIVTRHRVNEEGEYADTGSNKDYPLQIEQVKP
jgi:hypothetical protein